MKFRLIELVKEPTWGASICTDGVLNGRAVWRSGRYHVEDSLPDLNDLQAATLEGLAGLVKDRRPESKVRVYPRED